MEKHQHLRLPLHLDNIERKKRGGGGGFSLPPGRNKARFSEQASQKAEKLRSEFSAFKKQFSVKIDPRLIFEMEINQGVPSAAFEDTLASMGIHVLSVAEGNKGFWVVFSEDEDLSKFKQNLENYGSEDGPKHDFFHAIESFADIPLKKKIGKGLVDQPLTDIADFIDLELWKMTDPQKKRAIYPAIEKELHRFFTI